MLDDRFYKKETLLKVFGILSVVMLVCTFWMVLDDFGREWKGYQREFSVLKKKKYDKLVTQAQSAIDPEALAKAEVALAQARDGLKAHSTDLAAIDRDLDNLKTKERIATGKYQDAKAQWDVEKYRYEAKFGHKVAEGHLDQLGPKATAALTRLESNWTWVLELQNVAGALQSEILGRTAERNAIVKNRAQAEKQIKTVRADLDKLEAARDAQKFTFTKLVRSIPLLDLADPVFRLQQIVLPNIRDDIFFANVQRVDRCTTCHLAIDTPGFESEENPFKTHPKLDLMLASRSPHPIDTIGCTACHEGRGQSTHFVRAAHTPRNEEQKKRWERKYDWHEMHHVIEKMIPLQYTEGRCRTCHKETEYVPRAQRLNHAVQTVKSAGCYGCHRIEGWDHMRKPGPSLYKVKGKLTKEWISKWIRNPRSFNSHARMPASFHQSNISTDLYRSYNDAEIVAIADYLFELSDTYVPNFQVGVGSVERGKALVGSVGCLACHQVDDFGRELGRFVQAPDLSTVGSKVSKAWLTTWIKEPRHYWADTTMPSLRLSDSEVSDVTAYLLSKRNLEFETQEAPKTTDEVQRQVLRLYVQRDPKFAPVTTDKVDKFVGGLDSHDLSVELGRNATLRYGCFGCHEMKGLERTAGIGAELTEEGSKPVNKLDFGLMHLEHTNVAWFDHKMANSRAFDAGLVKDYLDLLRMPNYEFDAPERNRMITFLLGLTSQKIVPPAAKALSVKEATIEQGLRVAHKYNCQGCHMVEGLFEPAPEGMAGAEEHEKLRLALEGRIWLRHEQEGTMGPPPLITQGQRTQPQWAHQYLHDPGKISLRNKLRVRMPSFHMPNEEINQIVKYWASYSEDPQFPYKVLETTSLTPTEMEGAKTLVDRLQCLNCHTIGRKPTIEEMEGGSKGLAPDFMYARNRLRKEWIVALLKDPAKMVPGTIMPGFWPDGQTAIPEVLGGDSEKQIDALAKYILWLGQKSP